MNSWTFRGYLLDRDAVLCVVLHVIETTWPGYHLFLARTRWLMWSTPVQAPLLEEMQMKRLQRALAIFWACWKSWKAIWEGQKDIREKEVHKVCAKCVSKGEWNADWQEKVTGKTNGRTGKINAAYAAWTRKAWIDLRIYCIICSCHFVRSKSITTLSVGRHWIIGTPTACSALVQSHYTLNDHVLCCRGHWELYFRHLSK